MKIYQVGGSVRDMVLGKTPHDLDYVVVGASVGDMLAQGFEQVGKDFPVFLHPQTKDEYALARKEIKTGDKHTDFAFIFGPEVTLQEDLQRRDFTCNALTYDTETKEIVDLVNGLEDIENRRLRHVNAEHFVEDPLRVLRMCRFAAQLDFEVAPETMKLTQSMVKKGMIAHLTPERIWKELDKALHCEKFDKFVETMKSCGALKVIMPEVDKLWDTPENLKHHPEGNAGAHTLLTLKAAVNSSPKVKFALLLHDVGKSITPQEILPAHHGHEQAGLPIIAKICNHLKVPNEYRDFALLACKMHMKFRTVPEMKVGKIFDFVNEVSKFKDKNTLDELIEVCKYDELGRDKQVDLTTFEKAKSRCDKVFEALKHIKATDMPNFNKLPKDDLFKEAYRQYRLKFVRDM